MSCRNFVTSLLAGIVLSLSIWAQCPSIPLSVKTGDQFYGWCLETVHGRIETLSNGAQRCVDCPPGSAGTTSGGMFDGLLWKLLGLDPASQMAAKERAARKAALVAALENERQAAIARQDNEHARQIEAIAQRLQTGDLRLKGLSDDGDLQLKLSPTGPIRFTEYMSTPATQTTSAQLTLKTGDQATASIQPSQNASSAGMINPTPPTPLTKPDETSPDAKALAEMISKLPPAEQQKLIAAVQQVSAQGSETAPSTPTSDSTPSNGLSLKLSTEKQAADDTKAGASDAATSPEKLSADAAKEFDRSQQTSVPNVETGSAPSTSPDTTTPAKVSSNAAATTGAVRSKIDVPMWRPEGWVGSASKGDSTLAVVNDLRGNESCNSVVQREALERLAARSKQLAGVEVVINRLNATSPRLQSELAQRSDELQSDRDEFVDSMISKLTGQLFEARKLVSSSEFVTAAKQLSDAKEFADKIDDLNGKLQVISSGSKAARLEALKGILRELLDAAQPRRIAAIRKLMGPTIEFATGWYDAAEVGLSTIETFAKITAAGVDVKNLNAEVDARNRALASIEPLHKQLSADVDRLKHDPVLSACMATKP